LFRYAALLFSCTLKEEGEVSLFGALFVFAAADAGRPLLLAAVTTPSCFYLRLMLDETVVCMMTV
jgi:hypothetical protein